MQRADIKNKKKRKKKLGCLRDLIPGPLELQANALPTELRGPVVTGQLLEVVFISRLAWGDLTRETDQ